MARRWAGSPGEAHRSGLRLEPQEEPAREVAPGCFKAPKTVAATCTPAHARTPSILQPDAEYVRHEKQRHSYCFRFKGEIRLSGGCVLFVLCFFEG